MTRRWETVSSWSGRSSTARQIVLGYYISCALFGGLTPLILTHIYNPAMLIVMMPISMAEFV
jgi:hypothetical protein